jgi:hypothetical protein
VLPGSAGDAIEALAQVERVEAATGQTVARSLGDCAYGGGETRQAFADAGRELAAKVPQESENQGRFPKRAFVIDLEGNTVTCPGGQTTTRFTPDQDGGKTFRFGAVCQDCPLRAHCTTATGGRTVQVHAQEAMLQAARAAQGTPAGRARLRERVVVEHRLARLGQLGCGQARYRGRRKTRFQLLVLATIANLRWTWNWARRQETAAAAPARGAGETGADGVSSEARAAGAGETAARGVAAGARETRATGAGPVVDPAGGRYAGAFAFSRWLRLPHRLTPARVFGS